MEESTREQVVAGVADGIWGAFGYLSALDTDCRKTLQKMYDRDYGTWAPQISTFSEGVYEVILLYAGAARLAQGDLSQVARGLRRVTVDLPRGRVELTGPHAMRQHMHVVQSSGDSYRWAGI